MKNRLRKLYRTIMRCYALRWKWIRCDAKECAEAKHQLAEAIRLRNKSLTNH